MRKSGSGRELLARAVRLSQENRALSKRLERFRAERRRLMMHRRMEIEILRKLEPRLRRLLKKSTASQRKRLGQFMAAAARVMQDNQELASERLRLAKEHRDHTLTREAKLAELSHFAMVNRQVRALRMAKGVEATRRSREGLVAAAPAGPERVRKNRRRRGEERKRG